MDDITEPKELSGYQELWLGSSGLYNCLYVLIISNNQSKGLLNQPNSHRGINYSLHQASSRPTLWGGQSTH